VAEGIYQHVDVREEGKENAFSLGHTLWINTDVRCFPFFAKHDLVLHSQTYRKYVVKRRCFFVCCMFLKSRSHSLQEFEDLDEITARYIQPMASFARDLLGHKYFQDGLWGKKEVYLFTVISFLLLLLHNSSHSTTCFYHKLQLSYLVVSGSLSDRKWRSYWSRQRGRSLLSSPTFFRRVKICQGNSYWATSLAENHGEQKCF